MTNELKSCPNCGGHAKIFGGPEPWDQAPAIYCDSCPLGLESSTHSFDDLVAIWNQLPRRIRGKLETKINTFISFIDNEVS